MRNGFSLASVGFPDENGETETESLKNGDGHMLDTERTESVITPEEGNGSTEPLLATEEGKGTTNTHNSGHLQIVLVTGSGRKIFIFILM